MIVRSIAVQGWKCFADRVRLGRFIDRINVVYGPNGVGKSSLFQALVRGFIDAHGVGGEDAAGLRPWGRDLAPEVEIEFSQRGSEYRLKKRFLVRPMAELERREGGAFVRLAEGDAADERARQFLKANPPGRGLCQVKHWGIAQVLWTLQGDLDLRELSGNLPSDIRATLGAHISGPGGTRLEQRIEALYGEFFTSASGSVKSGRNAPEVVRLEEKLAALGRELGEARQRLLTYEEAARGLENLRASQKQLRLDADAAAVALAAAERRVGDYAELKRQRDNQSERVKAAAANARALQQQTEQIASCASELAKARDKRKDLEEQLPGSTRQAEDARRAARQRKDELETARARQQQVDAARSEAELAGKHNDLSRKAAALKERLGRIQSAEADLAAARSERATVVAPDAEALRAIRKAAGDRDKAQAEIDAALVRVEFVPALDGSLTVLAGDTPGRHTLSVGQPVYVKGSPEVVLDLDGVGRIRATGPAVDVEEDRQRRDRAARRLATLTESYGTTDLDRLEALHLFAVTLDTEVERKQGLLDGVLGGDTPDALREQLCGVENALAAIREQRPDWRESGPDAVKLAEEAQQLQRNYREVVQAAEAGWEAAEGVRTEAEKKEAEVTSTLGQLVPQIEADEERLRRLTADGKSDEARRNALEDVLLALNAGNVSLEKLDQALAEFPADPAAEAARLKRQLEAADESLRQAVAAEQRAEGGLEKLALAGPYSEVALLEEEAAGLAARIDRERQRMNGIRLLRQTIAECRAQEVAAVASPVERMATATLQRIAGRRLGGIRITEGFCPESVSPEQAAGLIFLDAASGGEREQVFLATRLALAELLAREERQTVVLDDVLVATDTGRLMRTLDVLEEASDKLQIVILTCHPERYRALDGAQFFDLEEIVAARAGAATA